MCQSLAQGGRRCANVTRPGYKKAMSALLASTPGQERSQAWDEARSRILDHAATQDGSGELGHLISFLESTPPSGLRRKATAAHYELIASLKTLHRTGQERLDMHKQIEAILRSPASQSSPGRQRGVARKPVAVTDHHVDAKNRGAASREAASRTLARTLNAPMVAAGVRQWDEVVLPHPLSGISENHAVVSEPKFTMVADPQTGEPVSQVQFEVRASGMDRPRLVSFRADAEVRAWRLAPSA